MGMVLLPCDLDQRCGSTRYQVGSTRSISSEVRLEGMVDKNLLLESTYNIRVFLSSVFRTDHFQMDAG